MSPRLSGRPLLILAIICFIGGALPANAQQPNSTPRSEPDDVIRVKTELIQSPVIVLDKQGNFVGGLTRDQFELNVDSHPRPLAFFEQITAGTSREIEKFKAVREGKPLVERPAGQPSFTGRTVIFFIDDFHLNSESVNRTRTAVLHYLENTLGQYDRALIISATGQIGFLQQLTDNRDVLEAAIKRLKNRDFNTTDETQPPMNAYQAFTIQSGDSGTLRYFADIAMQDIFEKQVRQMPSISPGAAIAQKDQKMDMARSQAENYVKNRARNVLTKYSSISGNTLSSLKHALASLGDLPGSKLFFFISDGFFLNQQISSELQKLNEISSGAVGAGTVVYSIQASGLSFAMPTAGAQVRLSPRGETGAPMIGQDTALQGPLYAIAVDTGGRALFNSNSMDGSVQKALSETAQYYLLAWRPDAEEKPGDLFHKIQVRIKDHPELTVRMQKGYFASAEARKSAAAQPDKPAAAAPTQEQQRAEKMREALTARYPIRDLQTIVNLSFLDQPTGAVLNIGTELAVGNLPLPADAQKQATVVDLAGIVLNDEGKTVSSFSGQLKFDLSASAPQGQTVSHVDELKVAPGLYQVRVAARDESSGITGSAAEWILVPDLTKGKLTLSSLLMGDASVGGATPDHKAPVSINHHFTRSGRLRFLTYIYNAARGQDGKSDVTVQLRVLRDDQVLTTSPQIKVPTEGIEDPARIPYAAEMALRMLPPGRYSLQVTANDNVTKASFTQRVKFVVE